MYTLFFVVGSHFNWLQPTTIGYWYFDSMNGFWHVCTYKAFSFYFVKKRPSTTRKFSTGPLSFWKRKTETQTYKHLPFTITLLRSAGQTISKHFLFFKSWKCGRALSKILPVHHFYGRNTCLGSLNKNQSKRFPKRKQSNSQLIQIQMLFPIITLPFTS